MRSRCIGSGLVERERVPRLRRLSVQHCRWSGRLKAELQTWVASTQWDTGVWPASAERIGPFNDAPHSCSTLPRGVEVYVRVVSLGTARRIARAAMLPRTLHASQ